MFSGAISKGSVVIKVRPPVAIWEPKGGPEAGTEGQEAGGNETGGNETNDTGLDFGTDTEEAGPNTTEYLEPVEVKGNATTTTPAGGEEEEKKRGTKAPLPIGTVTKEISKSAAVRKPKRAVMVNDSAEANKTAEEFDKDALALRHGHWHGAGRGKICLGREWSTSQKALLKHRIFTVWVFHVARFVLVCWYVSSRTWDTRRGVYPRNSCLLGSEWETSWVSRQINSL